MLAAVRYESRFFIDELMTAVARRLAADGWRVGGVVQENDDLLREDGSCCQTMSLIDLATGERFLISQALGPNARGCRLDPRGLAEVETRLSAALARGMDLLMLNKFGRAESEGGGLRAILSQALEAGVPVLTAVRPPYDAGWNEFHGGLAAELPPDVEAVLRWCDGTRREARTEAARA